MPQVKETSSKDIRQQIQEDVWIHSACDMCYSSCGTLVHKVNGVVVKIEGDPECPHNRGKLCAKGHSAIMSHYDPYRVKAPLRRTNPNKGIGVDPKWERIGWEEALILITEKMKKIRAEDPRKLILSTWDANFNPFLRPWMSAFGTPGPMLLSARCGSALHSATYLTNGTFNNEIDLDYCNYSILFGTQTGHMIGLGPNIMAQKMAEARARGMKLVVIDPFCNYAAAKADEWIPIRPGTDAAMALAMLNVLLNEKGIFDKDFLKKHTNAAYLTGTDGHYLRDINNGKPLVWDLAEGKAKPFDAEVKDVALEGSYVVGEVMGTTSFQALKDEVRKYTPEGVSSITSVLAETIRRIAIEFGVAARIGSKITIEGKELPYRPAAVNYLRGAATRKHGSNIALSISLLNLAIGAMHVPGGHSGVNVVGPAGKWAPKEDPYDGLIIPPDVISHDFNPYDFRPKPTMWGGLHELFPMAASGGQREFLSVLEPEKFKNEVEPEMMLHCRSNLMLSRLDPKVQEKILKHIPFIVSFNNYVDETTEFADIVLPDTSALERLVPSPNRVYNHLNNITGYWYWGLMQPVTKPTGEARHWWEVMVELADRVGFSQDFYRALNLTGLEHPYKLDLNKKYTFEEIIDRKLKSEFGPEHGLDWFKKNGYLKFRRKVAERYPILSVKPKYPIYFENYLRAGEKVKNEAEKNGIPWDTSDYLAIPDWKPNAGMERKTEEYDLYCINYKTPISFMSYTAENAWLNEIAERHPYYYKILINADTGRKKGIKDGDLVSVASRTNKVKGVAKLTELIHPEVIGIAGTFGSWAKGKPIARSKGVHFNSLPPMEAERLDVISGAEDECPEVKIYKETK